MSKLNWLEVASHMVKTGNKSLHFAPMSNIMNVEYNAKHGTKITMGISPENITSEFLDDHLAGGFIFFDKREFEKAKAELEAGIVAENRVGVQP